MAPKTIRWGILATGGIAKTFTKDLLVDPATRDVHTITHEVVAAASSSGASRAKDFLVSLGVLQGKAYGSYQELARDENVDIIYVATPHSHHYENVKLCLELGKTVLCEKAFTVNATQARELVRLAREKDLFLMEALWTRYFPLSIYAREAITSGKLGTLIRAQADNSLDLSDANFSADHRMVSPDLAGGSLLDMGVYSLTWIFQTLYTTQLPETRKSPQVLSSVRKYEPTGVDEAVSMLLTFPRENRLGGDMHGIVTTSFCVACDIDNKGTSGPAVRIQGTQGELQVWPPIYRPTRTKLILADGTVEDKSWPQPGPGPTSGWYNGWGDNTYGEGEGYGMFWEADEAALALIEGRKEGRYQGLEETVTIMDVMDQVRDQHGLRYPSGVEAAD